MRFGCLSVFLLAASALGQAADNLAASKSVTPANAPTPGVLSVPHTSKIADHVPVIVIAGLCDTPKKDASAASHLPCKTVITRAQFDAMADAIQPHMDDTAKAQLAAYYPKLLRMQHEFHTLGIENDARIKQALAFALLRAQADEADKVLKQQSSAVTDAEIQKYYNENSATYQESELLRLYVPFSQNIKEPASSRRNRADLRNPEEASRLADDPMRSSADAIRARAAAGEDFDRLQAEAFSLAGMTARPPDTNIGKHIASEMSQDHSALVAMALGEVSQVLKGANGYYIYKVISKDIRPVDQVRTEISLALAEQKFDQLQQKIEQSIQPQFNTTYFAKDPSTVAIPATTASADLGFGGPFASRGAARKPGRVRASVPPQVSMPLRTRPVPGLPGLPGTPLIGNPSTLGAAPSADTTANPIH